MATKKQYLFASGQVTENVQRTEVKLTEFEVLLKRVGLTEQDCMGNAEMFAWVKANKDRRYVPERLLRAMRLGTEYDSDTSAYSLTESGIVLEPVAPSKLQGEEVEDATPQT